MKTIGLLGGISWESTQEYYRIINLEVNKRLGKKHSARLRIYSFDFQEIFERLEQEDFEGIGERLVEEALALEHAGSDLLILCANTAHRWAGEIMKNTKIPLIQIGEATGKAIREKDIGKVLLLGTKYTMEGDFIKKVLADQYGIQVVVPGLEDQKEVNRIIFDELIIGIINNSSREFCLDLIRRYTDVHGVILGCTELPLIIKDDDCERLLFNTTRLHAMAAVDYALKQ